MTGKNIGERTYGTRPDAGSELALAIVIIGACASSIVADPPPQPGIVAVAHDGTIEIAPDDAYQAALTDLFNAPDKAAFNRQADQFFALRAGDTRQVVAQLLWFAARHHDKARTKAFVGKVLTRLEAPKDVIVVGLAPHLDNREENVRVMVQELLTGYEDRSATRQPDFSAYRALIEADVRAGKEPPPSLVRLMYTSDPGTALQNMVRACQLRDPAEIKAILWGEHVVAELFWKRRYGFVERKAVDAAAVQELDKLARHPRWWVRLYVAEIIRAHPELGLPEVLDRLKEDADRRVSKALQSEWAPTEKDSGVR